MMEIVLTCVFISMAICGLWLSAEPNMLLHFLSERLKAYKLYPAFIGCVTCMASIWGTIGWFAIRSINGLQLTDVIIWPIAILAIAFLNTILIRLT